MTDHDRMNGEPFTSASRAPATALRGKSVAECEDLVDARVIGVRHCEGPFARARHDTVLAKGDRITLDIGAEQLRRMAANAPPA